MIAPTAIVHDPTVVARNARDFRPFGVQTLDPFAARRGRRVMGADQTGEVPHFK